MRRQLGQVIDGPRPDGDGDGIVSLQGLLQRGDILVLGVELRVGEDEGFPADVPGVEERRQDRAPGDGESVRVGDQQGRLILELLPEHLQGPAQHAAAQFEAAGVPRRAQGLRN
jgi:hypothetical protein